MKITNNQILVLNQLLKSNLLSTLTGAKLNYALLKNINKIEKETEDIKKIVNPSDRYKEFDKKRIDICQLYCEKDDKGENVKKQIDANNWEFVFSDENKKMFDTELETIQEEYKEDIEQFKLQIEDYNKFLQEESKINFHKVSYKELPENISLEIMSILEFMLFEDEEI
jgi:hypothetical protein